MGSRILFGSLLLVSICYGQLTFPGKINPHGSDQCQSCHFDQGEPSRANFDPAACETCHSRAAVNSSLHQLDNINQHAPGISIPEGFKLSMDNRFDCTSCHTVACKTDRANQTFLRGGPYKTEIEFCFNCHQRDVFKKLNPHKQFTADGQLDESTCLHCHLQAPDLTRDIPENSYLLMDMTPTCNKCHALSRHEKEHLGQRIVGENQKAKLTLLGSEEKYGIQFPLSVNQEIQCTTCHYTHQRGVLNKENVVFENSGENQWKLRLSREQLCLACHDL